MPISGFFFTAIARNVERNIREEINHSGWTRTLSWIFNWKVPRVKHPQPWDVALNNFPRLAQTRPPKPAKSAKRRKQQSRWTYRKRKQPVNRKQPDFRPKWWTEEPHVSRRRFDDGEAQQDRHQPYYYEQPLSYEGIYYQPASQSH